MTRPISNEEVQEAIQKSMHALQEQLSLLGEDEGRALLKKVKREGLSLMLRGFEIRVFLELRRNKTSNQLEYA
jgi:hypothetical protein